MYVIQFTKPTKTFCIVTQITQSRHTKMKFSGLHYNYSVEYSTFCKQVISCKCFKVYYFVFKKSKIFCICL